MNKTIRNILAALAFAATPLMAVPSGINYQGALTDDQGNPITGTRTMSIKLYDAATGGTLLYSEDIGMVDVSDGVFSFEFGAGGESLIPVTETLAVADGVAKSYSGTLGSNPTSGSLSVTDGVYAWNVVDGNPGRQAVATGSLVNGFLVGVTVNDGGSGYTSAPIVTVTGNGTGATATAVVSEGVITAINVGQTGSGYTTISINIAAPPAPFIVDATGSQVSVTYDSAPPAGRAIRATYNTYESAIVGALRNGDSHWLEVVIDGVTQAPRNKLLQVPSALVARRAEQATGELAAEIAALRRDLAYAVGGWQSDSLFKESFAAPTRVVANESTMASYTSSLSAVSETVSVNGPIAFSNQVLTFAPAHGHVRYLRYRATVSGGSQGPLTFVFKYSDGTEASVVRGDVFSFSTLFYIANPNPQKTVNSVDIRMPNTGGFYHFCNSVYNTTRKVTLSLSGYTLRPTYSKVGAFLEISDLGTDVFSILLVGTEGSFEIPRDEYVDIPAGIGSPVKLVITHAPTLTNNQEPFAKLKTVVLRFSQ
jgi:hypothetical protein